MHLYTPIRHNNTDYLPIMPRVNGWDMLGSKRKKKYLKSESVKINNKKIGQHEDLARSKL